MILRGLFAFLRVASLAGLLASLALSPGGELSAQELAFPYAIDQSDWVWASAGVGLIGLGLHFRGENPEVGLDEIRALDPERINAFDRRAIGNWSPTWAHRSDIFRGSVRGAALLILGGEGLWALTDGRSDDALALGAMLGEMALLSVGTTFLTKVLVGRKRPFLYNEELSVEERYNIASTGGDEPAMSFISGHSSGVFAAATFASTVFQDIHGSSVWSGLVWGSTLSLATLTAYARVKAGVHFPTDVIVGALVGGGIGYLVPRLHERDEKDHPGSQGGGIMLSYAFRF
jgi:membrane-associated phospholipid phosphatase